MDTCFDYLKWRGDLSFDASPLNEIDLACLNMLIVLNFDGIIPENDKTVRLADACSRYFRRKAKAGSELGALEPPNTVPLAKMMKDCPRYADVLLSAYRKKYCEEATEQFGAVTCDLPGGERVIVYKSTDDTLIGWKEDFLMAVSDHLASQTDSLNYLISHAGDAEKLILTGHSKGGNLAAYAAIHAPESLQDRIFRVVSFDGPGFGKTIVQQESCKRIKDRIVNIVPQSSIVGMLLHFPGSLAIVLSEEKSLNAHVPLTWETRPTAFTRVSKLFPASQRFDKAFDTALEKLSRQDRIRFIDELFEILTAGGAETLKELKNGDILKIAAVAHTKPHSAIDEFFRSMLDEYLTTDGIRKIRDRHEKAAAEARDALSERKKAYSERRKAIHEKLEEKKELR